MAELVSLLKVRLSNMRFAVTNEMRTSACWFPVWGTSLRKFSLVGNGNMPATIRIAALLASSDFSH